MRARYAARAPAHNGVDQPRRPRPRLARSAARDVGDRRRADGRAWPPGPRLECAAPGPRCLCSWVIRDPGPLLSLAAGVAVAALAGESARVKWPNDVLIDGRKLAGILVEGRPQERWAVLGIGINVALRLEQLPPELRDRAATLALDPAELEPTLWRLRDGLERWLIASDGEVLSAVRSLDALRGRPVRWERGHGVGAGIDQTGRLLVTLADGCSVAIDAGEVHLGRGRRAGAVNPRPAVSAAVRWSWIWGWWCACAGAGLGDRPSTLSREGSAPANRAAPRLGTETRAPAPVRAPSARSGHRAARRPRGPWPNILITTCPPSRKEPNTRTMINAAAAIVRPSCLAGRR